MVFEAECIALWTISFVVNTKDFRSRVVWAIKIHTPRTHPLSSPVYSDPFSPKLLKSLGGKKKSHAA